MVVNDADAVYPVRIDPTFSDANWVSMGGLPGANGQVNAAVIDGSDNLYIGGVFTFVGNTFATNVSEWNGSSWSALGSGISGVGDGDGPYVSALAVSGSTLYAGGDFLTAGTNVSAYAAMANLPVPPTLSIITDGTYVVVTWPDAATGFTTDYALESATNLVPPVAWQTNSTAPTVIGGQNVITNPITGSQQFFRLFNP
jgi:hypothetical protein